jgi:translin
MQDFNEIIEKTRKILDERTRVRDETLLQARTLTRLSALTIRAIHRGESDEANNLLSEAHLLVLKMQTDLAGYPDLYFTGYTRTRSKNLPKPV